MTGNLLDAGILRFGVFAIIATPDPSKTKITEHILLSGGVTQNAS